MRPDRGQISAWMEQASSGDGEAFGLLAAAMQDELYRFGLAHGLSGADASEATQETLLRAYRGRSRWRVGGDAAAWLYGIALNVVRECREKSRRSRLTGLDPAVLRAAASASPVEGGPPDGLERLAAAMALLPPRQREAVTCRYLLEMSVRDTAEAMGCAEGTVTAAVAAALENLRNRIRREL